MEFENQKRNTERTPVRDTNTLSMRSMRQQKTPRSNGKQGYSTGTKFLMVFLVFGVTLALDAKFHIFAATKQAITLRSISSLDNGLQAHWTFDNTKIDLSSNTTEIKDSTANANDCDWQDHASTTGVGRIGQSIIWTGSGAIGDCGSPASIDNIFATGGTWSAWINRTGAGNGTAGISPIMIKGTITAGPSLMVNSSNVLEFRHTFSGTDGRWTYNPVNITGEWYFVTVTYDGSNVNNDPSIYINGVKQSITEAATPTGTLDSDAASTMYLSRQGTGVGANSYFIGQMDDIRIYNRIIDANEVMNLYKLGGTTEVNKTLTSEPNLENGLIDHWTFDGNAVDLSQNTGEIKDRGSNNITGDWEKHASTTIQAKVGQGIHFDGVNDDINMGTTIDVSNQSFSMALWERLDKSALTDNSQHHMIVQDDDGSGSNNNTLQLGIRGNGANSGRVTFAFFNNDLHTVSREYGSTTNWYHIVATYDATTNDRRLYINGALENSDTAAADYAGSGLLCVSRCAASPSSGTEFAGDMDDIRIYNRVLSPEEANAIYKLGATSKINTTLSSVPGVQDSLVGHWTMDGAQVTRTSAGVITATDKTGNGNNAAAASSATSPTPAVGKIGQAMSFDGTDDVLNAGSAAGIDNVFASGGTIAYWFKDTQGSFSNFEPLVNKGTDANVTAYVGFRTEVHVAASAFTFKNAFSGTAIPAQWNTATGTIATSTWYHVAVVYNNSSAANDPAIYINGVPQTIIEARSPSGTAVSDAAENLNFGMINQTVDAGSEEYGSSSLDDIRLYTRMLSQADVKALYDLGR